MSTSSEVLAQLDLDVTNADREAGRFPSSREIMELKGLSFPKPYSQTQTRDFFDDAKNPEFSELDNLLEVLSLPHYLNQVT